MFIPPSANSNVGSSHLPPKALQIAFFISSALHFNAFLEMIGLSEDELDSLPMVSFDSLSRDDAVIKDPRTRRYFEKKKSKEVVTVSAQDHKTTLGNLFGDLFAKLKEDLED